MIIIGAGPAGLNAALTLGRVRRRTLLLDGGPGRNAVSGAVHNLLSRDGIAPDELRAIALEQLTHYPDVEVRQARAMHAAEGFEVVLDDGRRAEAARLVLATGVRDVLPSVPGLADRWGDGVVHCPYCHGWERHGRRLAVLEVDGWGVHQAVHLARLSSDVVLCTNGGEISDAQCAMLADRGVQIREDVVDRLEGKGTALARIVFKDAGYLEGTTYCTPFYLPANCSEAAVRRLVLVILIGLLTWWAGGAV
ncbi:NAD(P)/FAD-dependent oxidoreductase [Nonomuraea angiospora]